MKRFARWFAATGLVVVFSHTAIAADSSAFANGVALQDDDKIVAAGYAGVGGVDQFALARYNWDGSLDTTLNRNGKVTTAVGTGTCKGKSLALQKDGKIVVVGYSFSAAGQSCFTTLRYRSDGSSDPTFGDSGKVITSVARHSSAESVALQSDGKLVVAGYSFVDGNNNDFVVVRYDADGKLDSTFNQTGKATADFGARDFGNSVSVYNDGRIVVAGYTAKDNKKQCALASFTAHGSLDSGFNGTGRVRTDFGGDGDAEGFSVAIQTDGKIVVAGYATVAGVQQFALARYNVDGTFDTSFGTAGRVLTAVGVSGSNATGVALQKDGKIVVTGYAVRDNGRGYDFACLRYNVDGSLDQNFGDHGKVTTAVGDGKASSVALRDGRIIVAGFAYAGDSQEFAIVRYDTNGKLDPTFNAKGSVLTAMGSKPLEVEDTAPRVSMAKINDPDGYTNVRDYDGKVIARVKAGEHFVAAKPWNRSNDTKWSVCLRSGITGFMDKSRIHLLPDEPLIKLNHDSLKKEWRKFQSTRDAELGETASAAKGRGLDYYKVLMAASKGDKKALGQFFSLAEFMDGAAAEGYFPDASAVFHIVGDKAFSNFVRELPVADQVGVRGTVMGGLSQEEFANGADVGYLQRYFPETTKILFRGEIVDWASPDGRYTIRKTFTDPLDLAESKVSHAELIEQATAQTLCDLTNADIGVGSDREGSVLWSPDSKRFAYVASDRSHPGNLFRTPAPPPQKTQTTVYQSSDKSFTKIDLPLDHPPGKESDPEIKGAVMGHEFVTPVRWTDANTLVLERHDYYEKLMPSSGVIHGFGRLYEITVSFKKDGTANTSWKIRDNP